MDWDKGLKKGLKSSWREHYSAALLLICFGFVHAYPAHAKFYKYTEFLTLDDEDYGKVIQTKLARVSSLMKAPDDSTERQEANDLLQDTLNYALIRPREDSVKDDAIKSIRAKMIAAGAYESTVESLIQEAVGNYSNTKVPKEIRASYFFMLKGLLAELNGERKKEASKYREFAKSQIQKIADAKIEIPKDVASEVKVRTTNALVSPSQIAKEILK